MENLHQVFKVYPPSFPCRSDLQQETLFLALRLHGKTMMERLFSSEAPYRTLALFFRYPEEPLNPRLISGHTGVDIKSVLRELKKLREIGILRVRDAGRYRMYTLNRRHPVFPGLRSIFHRSRKERESRHSDPVARIPEDLFTLPPP